VEIRNRSQVKAEVGADDGITGIVIAIVSDIEVGLRGVRIEEGARAHEEFVSVGTTTAGSFHRKSQGIA
jgi:hypothetical protein